MRAEGVSSTSADKMDELYSGFLVGHVGPIRIDEIADWAINNNKWQQDRNSAKRELKRRLTQWAKAQKYRDSQGRMVRLLHAAKYPKCVDKNGQMIFETMWDEHLKMSEIHAMLSFEQRARQIEGAHRSLMNDADSFNENNPNGQRSPVQLEFNFDRTIETNQTQQVERIRADDNPSSGPGLPR